MWNGRATDVTDRSDIEFSDTTVNAARAQNGLSMVGCCFLLWDFLSCATAGKLTLAFCERYMLGGVSGRSASGPIWNEIVLGSLLVTLFLHTTNNRFATKELSIIQTVFVLEGQCCLVFVLLIGVGSATHAAPNLGWIWYAAWLPTFCTVVACSRLVFGACFRRSYRRADPCDAAAGAGVANAYGQIPPHMPDDAGSIGFFDDDLSTSHDEELEQLLQLGEDGGAGSLILAIERGQQEQMAQTIERLKFLPVPLPVRKQKNSAAVAGSTLRTASGLPLAVYTGAPRKHWEMVLKFLLDKVGATVLILLLAPLFVAIALAVAMTSPGPIIFRQNRCGWCGRDFIIFKFRTMFFSQSALQYQTLRRDARCTPVGRLLRATSPDELPQLWNVLRGDMSLVGPRPHAEILHNIDQTSGEIVAEYAQRHKVKPGLTGWAQVNGARGAMTSIAQLRTRIEFDLYYIENWSIWFDIKILAATPFCMSGDSVF